MSLEAWGDESPEVWWNEDQIAEAESTIEALREALALVMRYPGIREYLGLQIAGVADAALSPNAK